MAETFRMEGLRQMGEAFKALTADVQGKVARATTNAGAQVIKKLAQQKAPVAKEDYVVRNRRGDSGVTVPKGNLPKKISVKWLGKKALLTSESIVFVKGKRKDGYANRIGVLQEFGTVSQSAKPFMRPAFEQGKVGAVTAMADRLRKRIDKATR